MLAIRLQRTGRRGHAQFRVVVQDSRFHPTRGRVVSYLGSYNPHTKTAQLDKDLAAKYLGNGAQPSDRVARLLQNEGVELPAWVKVSAPKTRSVRNAEKRRSTAPAQPIEEVEAEASAAEEVSEAPAEESTEESNTQESAEASTETTEAPAEESAEESVNE